MKRFHSKTGHGRASTGGSAGRDREQGGKVNERGRKGGIRVQNTGKNFRERASASWLTLIFRRASERELDYFKFLASERASSPARSQARSRSRSRLALVKSSLSRSSSLALSSSRADFDDFRSEFLGTGTSKSPIFSLKLVIFTKFWYCDP